MTRAIVIAAALMLGSCGNPGGDNAGQPRARAVPNPYQQKLLALSERDRNLTLRRGIQDDDGQCRRIEGADYQQEYRGLAMWVARCSEGRNWAVFVSSNGFVQARDCAHEKELGLPECKPAEAG